ncbi:MAG: acylphosphatase [Chitinivibrionales bacterium]|nr:acylphosphatase [Chitinivibrionales bacterium]
MPDKRISIVVSGRVQGVGFRFFTQNLAEQYRLSGWVRNRSDGKVEMEAQGNENSLNSFTEELQMGPSAGNVTDMQVNEMPHRESEDGFSIRY